MGIVDLYRILIDDPQVLLILLPGRRPPRLRRCNDQEKAPAKKGDKQTKDGLEQILWVPRLEEITKSRKDGDEMVANGRDKREDQADQGDDPSKSGDQRLKLGRGAFGGLDDDILRTDDAACDGEGTE